MNLTEPKPRKYVTIYRNRAKSEAEPEMVVAGWVRKVGVWRHPDGSMITRHWQKAYLNAKQEFVTVREAFECWKTTSQSANV